MSRQNNQRRRHPTNKRSWGFIRGFASLIPYYQPSVEKNFSIICIMLNKIRFNEPNKYTTY